MLCAYCILLVASIAIYIGARQINWRKIISHSRTALVRGKKVKTGSLEIQLLSGTLYHEHDEQNHAEYIVRIKLRVKESLKKDRILQYMSYGITKNFFAVQGGNLLEQTACEKIPCIDRNEFIYMTCFHRSAAAPDSNLLIYVADSLAGFGNSKFEFTSKALQQLD